MSNNIQIGYRTNMLSINMKQPHYHNAYELFYLIEGNVQYYIEHNSFLLKPGSIALIKPGVFHKTVSMKSAPITRYLALFDDGDIVQNENLATHICNSLESCFEVPFEDRRYVDSLFSRMYMEFKDKKLYCEQILHHQLNEFLLYLTRNTQEISVKPESADKYINLCLKFIETNYQIDISLDEAAKIANMSRTYFSSKFKAHMGVGFSDYLNKVRIEHSKNLLNETQFSMHEVAIRCGFNDGNYFIKKFKEHTGITPNKFRMDNML